MTIPILFVTGTVRPGGPARVLSLLANHWAAAGRPVSILTFDDPDVAPFFPLDDRIRIRYLGAPPEPIHHRSARSFIHAVQQAARLRTALRDGGNGRSILISFLTYYNILSAWASMGSRIPLVMTEHNPPGADSLPLRALRPVAYARADRLMVLNPLFRQAQAPWLRKRAEVLNNPAIVWGETDKLPSAAPGRRVVLGAGRLVKEKRFDLLIAAFARLKDEFPDWDLEIAGDGPLQPALSAQIKRGGLSDRARLIGPVSEMGRFYAGGSMFVLSSDREGFPMVLCEAMSAGLPVVARDCDAGPREIIRDGVDGLLAPKGATAELAAAMRRLMADNGLRSRLGREARSVTTRFSADRFFRTWDGIVEDLERKTR